MEQVNKKNIIIAKNICKSYYKKNIKEKLTILDNISIEFETGNFYAIMGHSGSEKTTLINILGLIDSFETGSLSIDDINIDNSFNDSKMSKIRMENIGFVFQDFQLDNNLKAIENVIFPMLINKNIPKNEREVIAIKLLDKMDLSDRKYHYINELSGGERQRVAIARALANNPNFLLADEPTGNLDKKMEANIFGFLKTLAKDGKCIIVVSHSEEVKKYADKVFVLDDGKIKEETL